MVRALIIIVTLVVGFLLSASHAAVAQGLDEANTLARRVFELTEQGHYTEAVPLAQRALALAEKALGPDHPDVATALSRLAYAYTKLGRYADAEPLYRRSLAISEKALGPDHSTTTEQPLYERPGMYIEPAGSQAWQPSGGRLDASRALDVATALSNLAIVYVELGHYADAEPL